MRPVSVVCVDQTRGGLGEGCGIFTAVKTSHLVLSVLLPPTGWMQSRETKLQCGDVLPARTSWSHGQWVAQQSNIYVNSIV